MYRELPDGARVDPPQIEGLMTFTSKYRNFNFMQQNAEGGFKATLSELRSRLEVLPAGAGRLRKEV